MLVRCQLAEHVGADIADGHVSPIHCTRNHKSTREVTKTVNLDRFASVLAIFV